MPLPIPTGPSTPVAVPGTPVVPPGRRQPSWYGRNEEWARDWVLGSHADALYRYGEYSMFVLMWRAIDHEQGLVNRCPVCSVDDVPGSFEAYQQPTRRDCPSCFGTTFEGGFRARIVRPALWTDRDATTVQSQRGEVVRSGMSVETTQDFSFFGGDYVFRINGDRYQGRDLNSVPIRLGFDVPDAVGRSAAGYIDQALLEDPASVAHLIPPDEAALVATLSIAPGEHLVPAPDSTWELIRGPLYRED